jgi:undecaprenyl-diphosphatase
MKTPDNEEKLTTPEERRAAAKARRALEKGFADVNSPREAAEVIAELEAQPARPEGDMPEEKTSRPKKRAEAIEAAGKGRNRTVETLNEAAEQVARAPEEDTPVLDNAISEAGSPENRRGKEGRRFLERELIKQLKPLEAMDTLLFVGVNHLPHPPAADRALSRLSWAFTGGHGWLGVLLLAAIFDRRVLRTACRVMPAVWIATWLVESPIKAFFRRRRPFISIVRAIVVGRKPGNYSFPSGHSAAAFSGAALLAREYPRRGAIFFLLAALIGFSRVYLGAHYPGDVVSGGFLGVGLARGVQKIFRLK